MLNGKIANQIAKIGTKSLIFWIALILCWGARCFVLISYPNELSGDGSGYVNQARYILNNRSLPPLFVQPHGLPLVIAPLAWMSDAELVETVQLINFALDSGVVWGLVFVSRKLLRAVVENLASMVFQLLIMIQPFTATMSQSVYTEQLCEFLLFFGVLAMLRHQPDKQFYSVNELVSGFLFGLATILRVELIVLFGLICSFMLFRVWLPQGLRFAAVRSFLFCSSFSIIPLSMLCLQYASTQEVGLAKKNKEIGGYYKWLRTWFAFELREHNVFAFQLGSEHWPGFEIESYPSRAFSSAGEKESVAHALRQWQVEGYGPDIDQQFLGIANNKLREHPVKILCLIPVCRMLHYWINLDGGQIIIVPLNLRRPHSTLAAGLAFAMRLTFLSLFVIGGWLAMKEFRLRQECDPIKLLLQASLWLVLGRTLSLGALGVVTWAGLMENRYVIVAFPFLIIVSAYGLARSINCFGLGASTNAPPA